MQPRRGGGDLRREQRERRAGDQHPTRDPLARLAGRKARGVAGTDGDRDHCRRGADAEGDHGRRGAQRVMLERRDDDHRIGEPAGHPSPHHPESEGTRKARHRQQPPAEGREPWPHQAAEARAGITQRAERDQRRGHERRRRQCTQTLADCVDIEPVHDEAENAADQCARDRVGKHSPGLIADNQR